MKIGDRVLCVQSGTSRGKGERYTAGSYYIVSHGPFSNETMGIEGLTHIVDIKNFKLLGEVLAEYLIFN